MTYHEQLQEMVNDYRKSEEPWPTTARMVASWALRTGRWKPQPASLLNQCADQISRAMRDEYITDPQGRRVRAKHAATLTEEGEQQTMWDDIRTAPHHHMELAFQQRRRGIVSDGHQLKKDVDSYNQNNTNGGAFQLSLDFTYDVQELELATVSLKTSSTSRKRQDAQSLDAVQV
jgi:hypothetical protein